MHTMKTKFNKTLMALCLLIATSLAACAQQGEKKEAPSKTSKKMEYNKLTKEEEAVIVHKGTEYPGTGKYDTNVLKAIEAPLKSTNATVCAIKI